MKYILVGGYPKKAQDGGKHFAEELAKGFGEPVKILDCLFARPRENWEKAYAEDKEFFTKHLSDKRLEFQLADPSKFTEQVKWANSIYIRGGTSDRVLLELQKQSGDWRDELQGKTLAGSSAGAHTISKYYYGLDDLEIGEGLGLVPVKVITHFRSDYNAPNIDWDRAEQDLASYKEDLPIFKLAEGQFEVITR